MIFLYFKSILEKSFYFFKRKVSLSALKIFYIPKYPIYQYSFILCGSVEFGYMIQNNDKSHLLVKLVFYIKCFVKILYITDSLLRLKVTPTFYETLLFKHSLLPPFSFYFILNLGQNAGNILLFYSLK